MKFGVALALAYARETNQAQATADDLGKRFPEDTLVQFNYLPTIRARLALNRSLPEEALPILDVTTPYELGWASSTHWPNLYPVYVGGEAYLAAE